MKKLLLILGIPVAVVVVAIAALVLFVNPNQFKPVIVEQTKAQTGLDLVIDGDIEWSFFPSLGLSLGRTELKNPQGFKNENLLKIDTVNVDVSVMPLLSSELYIGNVALDGAEIYLETLKDGRSNLDSLTSSTSKEAVAESTQPPVASEKQPETAPATAVSQEKAQAWKINLAGISITNALLEIRDDKAGSYTKLYDVGLAVSEFAFEQWTTATFEAKGQNNEQKFAARGQAELKLSEDLAGYQLRNIELESSFNDPATDISSAKVSLESFAFDALSPMKLAVKGNAADMALDVNLAATLLVDQAISVVKLDNIELQSSFEGAALPQSPMNINGKMGVDYQMAKQKLSLAIQSLALNDINLDGNANVTLADIPAIRFDIHSPDIDLDEFLGLTQAQDTASAETKPSGETEETKQEPTKAPAPANEPAKEVEPDLSALKTLDIAGGMLIDKFKANNVEMQNVNAKFSVNRGIVTLSSFSSNLYEGSIKASAKLDGRKTPATYSVKKQITGVKVQPLLKAAADNEMLEGTGNIDADLTGKSLTPTGIKQNLAGTVNINFADGAVNGINLAQMVREGKAKLKGEEVSSADAEQKKTDFSALTSTITLSKGVAKTNNFSMASPFIRVKGSGETNYLKETMDFLFDTSIVGTSKGQGGKDIDELKDVTIPVRVYNMWTDPKYKVELSQFLKALEDEKKKELEEKAKKEAERGLKKLLGDKAGDEETKDLADKLLKGLFN